MYKVIGLMALFSLLCLCSNAQTVIWSEDFQGEANGATSGSASGTPGGTWSVTTSPGSGTFAVSGGAFGVDNTGAEGVWSTNTVNISAYGYAIMEVTLQAVGLSFGGDYIRAYYSVDGGAEVLFAEINSAFLYNGSIQGSAIVSGNTLRIIVRGYDGSFLAAYSLDDVTITASNRLYSRKSGNWDDLSAGTGTWSLTGHTGAACACAMSDRTTAIIGPGHVVSLTGNASVGALQVRPLGVLQWTAANQVLTISRGFLGVDGELRGNGYSNAGITLSGGYATSVPINGTGTINDMTVTGVPSVSLTGSGNLTLTDQLLFTTNTIAFSNDLNYLSYSVLNTGNRSVSVSNTGVINQGGIFGNVNTASYVNQTGAIWNYSGGTAPPAALDATATNNTFNYAAAGNQTVRAGTYYHLRFTGSGTKTMAGALTVAGNFSIENTATLNSNANGITLSGNWSMLNTASFTEGSATVTLNGSTNSTIVFDSPDNTFANLTINKSAAANTVTMNDNMNVATTLTLTRGRVVLNGNTLNILRTAPAAITGASASSYIMSETLALPYSNVNWTMATTGLPQSYVFPFGNASGNYLPFTFNLTNAGAGTARSLSVSTYPTAANNTPYPSTVLHMLGVLGFDVSSTTVDRFWIINPVGYTTQPTADVTFTAATADVGSITTLRAQRWNASAKGWDLPIAGQTSTTVTAKVNGVSSFSPWTLSGNSTPLPVTLTNFTARQQGDEALLQWTTATELNNDYFDVERSTGDLEKFVVVYQQKGSGTSSTVHRYSAVDPHPLQGKNYYRLKQVDFDGNPVYSDIVVLDFDGATLHGPVLKVYPNPVASDKITVEIYGIKAIPQITISLVNMTGQTVFEKAYPVDSDGVFTKEIVFNVPLPHGVYILKTSPVDLKAQKIIIE